MNIQTTHTLNWTIGLNVPAMLSAGLKIGEFFHSGDDPYTGPQWTVLHSTGLYYTTLYCTTLDSATPHSNVLDHSDGKKLKNATVMFPIPI